VYLTLVGYGYGYGYLAVVTFSLAVWPVSLTLWGTSAKRRESNYCLGAGAAIDAKVLPILRSMIFTAP